MQTGGDPVDPEVSRRVSAILDAAEREVTEIRKQAREEALRYMEYARRRADGLVAERQLRISELSGELLARAEHLLNQVESAEPLREALDDLVRKLTETAEGLTREAGHLDDFVAPDFGEVVAETPPGPSPVPSPAPAPDPAPEPGPPEPPTPVPEPAPEPPPAAAAPERLRPVAPAETAWPRAVRPAVSTPPPEPAPPPRAPEPEPPRAYEPEPPSPHAAQMVAIQMAAAGATRSEVESQLRYSLGVENPSSTLDDVFGPGSSPEDTVSWARPNPE